MASSRFSIASSRPTGVSGTSSGQAACRSRTAFLVASLKWSSASFCLPAGWTTASSAGSQLGRLDFGSPQRSEAFAWPKSIAYMTT